MSAKARPRTLRVRETIGHVLIAIVVIGLIVLVYWIVTERPCPRFPGIEKLRRGTGPMGPVSEVAVVDATPTTFSSDYRISGLSKQWPLVPEKRREVRQSAV